MQLHAPKSKSSNKNIRGFTTTSVMLTLMLGDFHTKVGTMKYGLSRKKECWNKKKE